MNTLSDHEANRVAGRGRPGFLRLLAYVRPYVPLVLLAIGLSFVYSGGRYGRAYLMKPIFDDILLPAGVLSAEGVDTSWLPELPIPVPGIEKPAPESAAPVPELTDAQRAEIEAGVRRSFGLVVLYALLIVLGMPIVTFFRDYLVMYALGRVDLDMKLDVCGKLLALPLRVHRASRHGDVLARVMADLAIAHSALSILFSKMLQSLVMIVVGTGALFFISWKLALVMLLIGPVVFVVVAVFGRRIRKSARRRQEQLADVAQRLVEILSGIKVIKAFRAERFESEAFGRSTFRLFRRGMKVAKNRVMARALVDMVNNAAGIGILILGMLLVLRGQWGISAGDLAAFAAISMTIYMPVKAVARGWSHLMDSQASADRFFELLDIDIDLTDAQDAVRLEGVRKEIRLRNVSFAYAPERARVLENIDVLVKAGEVVAIVGRTGAGKTTLVDLLMRFFDPTSGSIEIDGIDLRRVKRDSLLDQMAVVTQEPFLFDTTILENIRYGRADATDEEVRAAARGAYVDEFVDSLPEGYQTEVGVLGTRLSGGQRQRITIARAILRDPAILILDEATSALDSKSERYVQEAIDALLGSGRTVFVIAHRLSTVRRADQIIVLDGGRVTQTGTHEELVAAGGLYQELVELQSGPEPAPLN